jgi:hypothetical protein
MDKFITEERRMTKPLNVDIDCDRKVIIALGEEINNLVKVLNKATDILGEHERRINSLEKKQIERG